MLREIEGLGKLPPRQFISLKAFSRHADTAWKNEACFPHFNRMRVLSEEGTLDTDQPQITGHS